MIPFLIMHIAVMYIINIEDMKRLPGVLKMLCCVWKCYIYPALSVWYLISANRGFPSDPTSSRLASSCRTRNDKKWQVLMNFGKNSKVTFTILNRGSIFWTRLISCKNVFFELFLHLGLVILRTYWWYLLHPSFRI